ncbi:hypothetical protein F53441_13769 [Fusarium austroafricanum]|uniref:Protein kinase domain-containing protein n=1 Tax=Fusarium austroafricanum TaxID=2364996 RepID=A0A8H4JK67_9HYPO|nr:hypothetical protein F53441_13769 [Fusarium austroafricanum]
MEGSLSDLVRDYQLMTRYDGIFTIHLHNDPDAPPSSPHRQERWKKVRTLGHGGQGDVVLETCIDGGRSFTERAVKKVLSQQAKYSQYFVKLLGWYATSNKLYMAMEYFPEGDLYTYICDHEQLPEKECSQITSQILSGLALMHAEGFAHRDVKPQNILIHRHPYGPLPDLWWVKLTDFGISKRSSTDATLTTFIPGTFLYMAPELFRSDSQGPLATDYRMADVWAVGVTAFFILTKRVPFKSQVAIMEFTGNMNEIVHFSLLEHCKATEDCLAFLHEVLNPQVEMRPDAETAKYHAWTHNWVPEVPHNNRSPSTISSARSSFDDSIGPTAEISTLASQTASNRWIDEIQHNAAAPKVQGHLESNSDVRTADSPMDSDSTKIENVSGNTENNPSKEDQRTSEQSSQKHESWNVTGTKSVRMAGLLSDLGVNITTPDLWTNIDKLDGKGRTQLFLSASRGDVEMARVLCDRGAIIEATSYNGHTPLQAAARNGHTAVVDLLLEKGACIETPTVAKLLIGKGANIEATGEYGDTPLICAAKHGSEAVVKLLIEKGANLETANETGSTPLICAAKHGHEGLVGLLLKGGANIEALDIHRETALVHAVMRNHEAVAKVLLEQGANSEATDESGTKCLTIAARKRNKTIVDLLVQNGAKKDWSYYRARFV